MKKYLILTSFLTLGLFFLNNSVFAQAYTVIKTRGKIALRSSGRVLQIGSKFKATPLTFSSTKDLLVVLDENKAVFLISPTTTHSVLSPSGKSDGEDNAPSRAHNASNKNYDIKPLPSIGTRPGLFLTDFQLKAFFMKNNNLLLLYNRFSLKLSKDIFPMDVNHFFYIEYTCKRDTIRKKLEFKSDTLVITANELYKLNDKPIDTTCMAAKRYLWYYNDLTKTATAYSALDYPIYFVSPNVEELKQEVRLLLQSCEDKPKQIKLRILSNYLSKFYGTVGNWELEQLLKETDR